MPAPQLLLYAAVAFFVIAAIARIVHLGRHPVHMRWELYPVAHEGGGRAAYGGSHFEEPDHWRAPRALDRRGEIGAALREIFMLEGVRRHNPGLWRFSLPFHAACYLLTVWLVLLLTLGALQARDGLVARVMDPLALAVVVLGVAGAGGLLIRRLGDPALRPYNAPADYANLLLWLVYFSWMGVAHLGRGTFETLLPVSAAFVRLQAAPIGAAVGMEMVIGAVLLAYLPLSRMFHFVAKYFLYHGVRWEDEPARPGGRLEARLQQAMDFGVAWSAPHVGGARRWADAAAAAPEEDRS